MKPFSELSIRLTVAILKERHTSKSRTWEQEAEAYIAELPHPTPKRDIEMVRSAAEWLESREEQQ